MDSSWQNRYIALSVVCISILLTILITYHYHDSASDLQTKQSTSNTVLGTSVFNFSNLRVNDIIDVPIKANNFATTNNSSFQAGSFTLTFNSSKISITEIEVPYNLIGVGKELNSTNAKIDVAKWGESDLAADALLFVLKVKVVSEATNAAITIAESSEFNFPNVLDPTSSNLDLLLNFSFAGLSSSAGSTSTFLSATSSSTASGAEAGRKVRADFDGDGKSDLSGKTDGENWGIDFAVNGFKGYDVILYGYGTKNGVMPAVGDMDGDGKSDLVVKTIGLNGVLGIDYAANGFRGWGAFIWGNYGGGNVRPFIGDFDGDGKDDLSGKFDREGWGIDYAANGFRGWDLVVWGYGNRDTVQPAIGDFDGDGKDDLSVKTVWEDWAIDYAADGFNGWNVYLRKGYGKEQVVPVVGDYDGDGKDDLGVKTPWEDWAIDYAADGFNGWNVYLQKGYGINVYPLAADFDGDGKDDISVKTRFGALGIDLAHNGFNGWDIYAWGYGLADIVPVAIYPAENSKRRETTANAS